MNKKLVWIIAIVLCFAVSASAYLVGTGRARKYAKHVLEKFRSTGADGQLITEEIIETADGHKVLLDHPKGYSLSFPDAMSYDITNSPEFIKFYDEDLTVTVTREWAPYPDVVWYIDNYLNNYILNERYIATNGITFFENSRFSHKDAAAQLIALRRTPERQLTARQNDYVYFYVLSKTGKQAFFRLMFKTYDYERSKDKIMAIIDSFEEISLKGKSDYKSRHTPKLPQLSAQTKTLYDEITTGGAFKWGLFVDGAYTKDIPYTWFSDIEQKVGYRFDFSLHYINLSGKFPTEALQKMYDRGVVTELTLQISNHANDDLFGENPNFAVYDGLEDDTIRSLARGAKAFGHPFLLRLNNEMNSDWVNYSGVAALSDPDIFIENWRRIYRIFAEEGVDNAIWIFNPNAEDCPPCHWNANTAYFPGDEYVQMIGMTGYNTGTYYADLYHEKWRTFDEIYKEPYEKYMTLYGDFPFIITEFASSSVGGSKAAWITDMFARLGDYPNIRMALWWSSADYDMRKESYKHIARPYFLDETDATAEAFAKGLEKFMKKQAKK